MKNKNKFFDIYTYRSEHLDGRTTTTNWCCEKLESLGIAQKRRRRIGMDNGRDRDGLMIMMCANILSGTT